MKKYLIEVTRITYSTKTVEVEANDEHEALEQADDLANNLDFYTDNVDYEYSIICQSERLK